MPHWFFLLLRCLSASTYNRWFRWITISPDNVLLRSAYFYITTRCSFNDQSRVVYHKLSVISYLYLNHIHIIIRLMICLVLYLCQYYYYLFMSCITGTTYFFWLAPGVAVVLFLVLLVFIFQRWTRIEIIFIHLNIIILIILSKNMWHILCSGAPRRC